MPHLAYSISTAQHPAHMGLHISEEYFKEVVALSLKAYVLVPFYRGWMCHVVLGGFHKNPISGCHAE